MEITIPPEFADPQYRLANLYQIRTKIEGEEGEDVMFEPNAVQRKIYQAIELGWKRIIILKPRKLGVTTAIAIYFLDKTLYEKNQICRTIAHRRETAGDLFSDIVAHSYRKIMPELIISRQIASSTKELAFDNGSAYSIDVEARGKTPTKLHFTEVAYFEDEKKFEDSLISLPRSSLGIFESTANGKGNWFERNFTSNWQILQDGGVPEIYPLFFAWFDDPNNIEHWHAETVLYYPSECAEMQARFPHLTQEQILFWDRQRHAFGARLPEVFPSTPEEAFIFSTGKVYGDEFRAELNIIPPISYPTYELALDWGQTNPLVIQAIHRDNDDNFICFKELYRTNMPLAEVRKWLDLNCPENRDSQGYFHIKYPDPSVFNETLFEDVQISPGQKPRNHRYSIADEFRRKHKIILHRGVQNDLAAGIVRMKDYLKFHPERIHPFKRDSLGKNIRGAPKLFITSNCDMTIKEFDLYRWPKDPAGTLMQHSYEVPMKKNDHAMDALRYAVMTWTYGEGVPVEAPPPQNTLAYHLYVSDRLSRLEQRLGGTAGGSDSY